MRRKLLWGLAALIAVPAALYPLGAGPLVDGRQLFEDVRSRIETGSITPQR